MRGFSPSSARDRGTCGGRRVAGPRPCFRCGLCVASYFHRNRNAPLLLAIYHVPAATHALQRRMACHTRSARHALRRLRACHPPRVTLSSLYIYTSNPLCATSICQAALNQAARRSVIGSAGFTDWPIVSRAGRQSPRRRWPSTSKPQRRNRRRKARADRCRTAPSMSTTMTS